MRVSVVLSTFNQPDRLELSLLGYAAQTHKDFEIVLADDGSTSETRQRLDAVRRETGLDIRHVWQQDRGFRKCRILNLAIVAATNGYLVFSDGDCIPRADFVATHVRLASPGRYVSGGRCRLPQDAFETIDSGQVLNGQVFELAWWLRKDQRSLRSLLKTAPGPRLARWLDRCTTTRATWNGHNASGWKDHLLAVNGFDERLGYGGEDRELGERLENFGVRPIQARHRAVVLHLDHPLLNVDPDSIRVNRELRRRTTGVPRWLSRWDGFTKGPQTTRFGIRQLPATSAGSGVGQGGPILPEDGSQGPDELSPT